MYYVLSIETICGWVYDSRVPKRAIPHVLEATRKQARFQTPKFIKNVQLYWNDKEVNHMGWRCHKLQS
jgi:hypothetical protein